MEKRIVVGLVVLAAVVGGLAGDAIPANIIPTALVVLGLWYGWRCIDAEDATDYLAVAIAVGLASHIDVLATAGLAGPVAVALESILDQMANALLSGVVSVLVVRAINRLKG